MNNFLSKDQVQQELDWVFGDKACQHMCVALAGAIVMWRPVAHAHAVVRGPQALVEQVCLDGGYLGVKAGQRLKMPMFSKCELVVELCSPAISQWTLEGSGALYLRGVDQEVLQLTVRGSGDIYAAGVVDEVKVDVVGSGEVNTAMLLQQRAVVRISGHADVVVAPTECADLKVDRGDVRVLSRPKKFFCV